MKKQSMKEIEKFWLIGAVRETLASSRTCNTAVNISLENQVTESDKRHMLTVSNQYNWKRAYVKLKFFIQYSVVL